MAAGTITLFGAEKGMPEVAVDALLPTPYEKQYYTIGEVAQMFGVRISNIRFWTTEFALKVRTTQKGDRLYTPAIIEELRIIYHLVKECGYTISGTKAKLKGGLQPALDKMHLKDALLALRNELITIRNELL